MTIERDSVTQAVAAALRRRAPNSNRSGWYMELADAIGANDDSIANWCYGKTTPELHFYFALCRHFGADFAEEVQGELTGIHCSGEKQAVVNSIAQAIDLTEQLADVLKAAGNGKLKRVK